MLYLDIFENNTWFIWTKSPLVLVCIWDYICIYLYFIPSLSECVLTRPQSKEIVRQGMFSPRKEWINLKNYNNLEPPPSYLICHYFWVFLNNDLDVTTSHFFAWCHYFCHFFFRWSLSNQKRSSSSQGAL